MLRAIIHNLDVNNFLRRYFNIEITEDPLQKVKE